ncbi:hypothetical protein [Chryseobacterium sp. c4a]|uniref:hypothetical protein n=1 Tax=Chryseobacterium sp. c4a TaxID=1573582 RepID=UPI0013582D36|nr:hypothetical protein [Chryseobacterium sp. c4a]
MLNKTTLKDFIYWTSIFIVSISMLIYGLSKPFQFGSVENTQVIGKLSGQQLMWAFYGYSKLYPIIIGFFEVTGALLILFNRTRVLGCLLLTTILVNIIIQDYVFHIVALSSAIYYQILIILLLVFDRDKVVDLLKSLFFNPQKGRINVIIIAVSLIVALILKFYETKII